jgi:hypothetical protein
MNGMQGGRARATTPWLRGLLSVPDCSRRCCRGWCASAARRRGVGGAGDLDLIEVNPLVHGNGNCPMDSSSRTRKRLAVLHQAYQGSNAGAQIPLWSETLILATSRQPRSDRGIRRSHGVWSPLLWSSRSRFADCGVSCLW